MNSQLRRILSITLLGSFVISVLFLGNGRPVEKNSKTPEHVVATMRVMLDPQTGAVSVAKYEQAIVGKKWVPWKLHPVFATEQVLNEFLDLQSEVVSRLYQTCSPGVTFRITATWKNKADSPHLTGVDESRPTMFARVRELSNNNQLITADRSGTSVGAEQDLNIGTENVLAPGETTEAEKFDIRLASCQRFTFFVDIIGTPVLDLDIDSDNDNDFSVPARTQAEDTIEDDPSKPGKILGTNSGDSDLDGIPDFADGFNFDGIGDNQDDRNIEERFVPVVVELARAFSISQTKIRLTYSASDPASVTRTGTAPTFGYEPAPGDLRIWTNDGNQDRTKGSIVQGGHYVPPETYNADQLGFTSTTRTVTLYVEGIAASTTMGDQRILIEVDPDDSGPATFSSDAVRVTTLTLQWVNHENKPVDIAVTTTEEYQEPYQRNPGQPGGPGGFGGPPIDTGFLFYQDPFRFDHLVFNSPGSDGLKTITVEMVSNVSATPTNRVDNTNSFTLKQLSLDSDGYTTENGVLAFLLLSDPGEATSTRRKFEASVVNPIFGFQGQRTFYETDAGTNIYKTRRLLLAATMDSLQSPQVIEAELISNVSGSGGDSTTGVVTLNKIDTNVFESVDQSLRLSLIRITAKDAGGKDDFTA